MINYNDWESYLCEQVENGSIYLWGGQGEGLEKLTDEYIEKRETSKANADKVKALRDKNKTKHPDLRAYDCSGLAVAYLLEKKEITSDMTANGIYSKCEKITKEELVKGDFVFRWNSAKTKIEHIGYYIGNGEVIHAKGRAYGVIREPINKSTWNAFGRSSWIEKEAFIFTENLYYKKCYKTKRKDVEELQKLLKAKGYELAVNGYYGAETTQKVKLFQRANKLVVDGVSGKNTIKALGGTYEKI